MHKKILYLITLILFFSCKKAENETPIKSDKPKNFPIWGNRFELVGDFDGDKKTDTLKEFFYSLRDKKEVNKFYSAITDDNILYDSIYKRNCISFFLSNNKKLDTVPVGGIFGPIWLKNEGNIDAEKGDEISYVPSLPQVSSMNHCHIISFKNGKWKEIYSFEVREWQFPPLPEGGKTYGLFGSDGLYYEKDKVSNKKIENNYDKFPGLIKKIKNGIVEIQTFNSEVIDTTIIVNLTKHPKNFN